MGGEGRVREYSLHDRLLRVTLHSFFSYRWDKLVSADFYYLACPKDKKKRMEGITKYNPKKCCSVPIRFSELNMASFDLDKECCFIHLHCSSLSIQAFAVCMYSI
jgi:hypothetical protein